ncbi:MAG: FAD-dependent monooxygenase [Caulobacteraceae bacterium]|nr:FAD-dependent monooxygenase [Caulobacteraceae bacterium]
MERKLRVGVAGCGPAGLAAALLLRRDGHEVRLFERFERPQPLGSGLMIQPTGLAVLDELGLAGRLGAVGARVDRLFGKAAPSGRVVLDVRYAALGALRGLGVHRASLFQVLYDAAVEAGIAVETGRAVTGAAREGEARRLSFADGGRSDAFDLVVDALGSGSPLAPACGRALDYGALWASLDWPEGAGFDPRALEQRYRAASIMVGVLPLGPGVGGARPQAALFWSLRADRLAAWREAGLAAWKSHVAALWPACAPLLDQIASPEQMTFARYTHRTVPRPVEPGLVHIGDSWHSASPQLGQGANMAMLDAYALAQALRDGKDLSAGLRDYVRLRRGHIRLYQAITAAVTPVYQSDGRALPFLRDRLVGLLGRFGPTAWAQAMLVAGAAGAPLRPLGLKPGRLEERTPELVG